MPVCTSQSPLTSSCNQFTGSAVRCATILLQVQKEDQFDDGSDNESSSLSMQLQESNPDPRKSISTAEPVTVIKKQQQQQQQQQQNIWGPYFNNRQHFMDMHFC